MARIVYFAFPRGGIQGGHKMAFRHVETLRELGFDAVIRLRDDGTTVPNWFGHSAPVITDDALAPEDILVIPEDASRPLNRAATLGQRTVIFTQSFQSLTGDSLAALDRFPPGRLPVFMAVGPGLAATVRRLYPQATAEVVRCFADERVFQPGAERRRAVAYAPRKRPQEVEIIRGFFRKFHPDRADLPWVKLLGASEAVVARTFGEATLHLSLPRMESVGLTTLEALAAGCVCAGFRGVGGREYATPDNGFWVDDDDCEAAADALRAADDLAQTGGPALAHLLDASQETARQWSYAGFRASLEDFWMRHAPDARLRSGPLDG